MNYRTTALPPNLIHRSARTSITLDPQTKTQSSSRKHSNDFIGTKKLVHRSNETNKKRPLSQIKQQQCKHSINQSQPRMYERSSAPVVKYSEPIKVNKDSNFAQDNLYTVAATFWQNNKEDEFYNTALDSKILDQGDFLSSKIDFFKDGKKYDEPWNSPSERQVRAPLKLYPIESPETAVREKPEEYEEFIPIRNFIRFENALPYKKTPYIPVLKQNIQNLQPGSVFVKPLRPTCSSKSNPYRKKYTSQQDRCESPLTSYRSVPSKDLHVRHATEGDDEQSTSQKEFNISQLNNRNYTANYGSFLVRKTRSSKPGAANNADLSHRRNKTMGISNFELNKKVGMMEYRNMNPEDLKKLLHQSNGIDLGTLIGYKKSKEFEGNYENLLEQKRRHQKEIEEYLNQKKTNSTQTTKDDKCGRLDKEHMSFKSSSLTASRPTSRPQETTILKGAQTENSELMGPVVQRIANTSNINSDNMLISFTEKSTENETYQMTWRNCSSKRSSYSYYTDMSRVSSKPKLTKNVQNSSRELPQEKNRKDAVRPAYFEYQNGMTCGWEDLVAEREIR